MSSHCEPQHSSKRRRVKTITDSQAELGTNAVQGAEQLIGGQKNLLDKESGKNGLGGLPEQRSQICTENDKTRQADSMLQVRENNDRLAITQGEKTRESFGLTGNM